MKKSRVLVLISTLVCICILVGMLGSCEPIDPPKDSDIEDIVGSIDTSIGGDDVDSSYDEGSSTKIVFSEGSAAISGTGAVSSGSDVTLTGTGTFVISGETSDGSIVVDCTSSGEAQIVLSGLDLTNANGPAIYVKNAKKVTLTIAEGTSNTLSDGNSYSLTDGTTIVDGAIFAKSNLVLNGEGTLTVNGNNAHGIVSKDKLTVTGGEYKVNSTKSGMYGKDAVKISSADITINAGTDGIKSDNDVDTDAGYIYIKDGSFNITSVNDAVQAINVVSIEGGSFTIKTTSTSTALSAKGVKGTVGVSITGGTFVMVTEDDSVHSDGDIAISAGDLTLSSADDGVHANDTLSISGGRIVIQKSYEGIEATNINVSGGYIEINSTDDGMNAAGGNDSNSTATGRPGGDMFESGTGSIVVSGGYIIMHNEGDGVDSNGTLEVTGGVILVDGPQSGGNGSFDYGSSAKITGGVVITLGTSDMAQNFSEATQGSILVNSSSSFAAGTVISLCDDNGNVVLAFTSTKSFRCALFSAPELEKGKTYTFYTGATVEGLDENGYAHNTTQTGGTSCGSVTLDDYICGQGSGMGGGGFPGRP